MAVSLEDLYSRKILSWRLSNSMDSQFCEWSGVTGRTTSYQPAYVGLVPESWPPASLVELKLPSVLFTSSPISMSLGGE